MYCGIINFKLSVSVIIHQDLLIVKLSLSNEYDLTTNIRILFLILSLSNLDVVLHRLRVAKLQRLIYCQLTCSRRLYL